MIRLPTEDRATTKNKPLEARFLTPIETHDAKRSIENQSQSTPQECTSAYLRGSISIRWIRRCGWSHERRCWSWQNVTWGGRHPYTTTSGLTAVDGFNNCQGQAWSSGFIHGRGAILKLGTLSVLPVYIWLINLLNPSPDRFLSELLYESFFFWL